MSVDDLSEVMPKGRGPRESTVEEVADAARRDLKNIESAMRAQMHNSRFNCEQAYPGQHGEMKAQIMLTVRHLEDARMRCGKVLQYAGDGVSILDK